MDKSEKQRRNDIKRSLKRSEKEAILNSCPIPPENLDELFMVLDERLAKATCDGRFRITFEYLDANGLTKEPVIEWLIENGGGCDCEIVFNIEGAIND